MKRLCCCVPEQPGAFRAGHPVPGVSAGPYVMPRASAGAGQTFAKFSRSGVSRRTLPSSGSQLMPESCETISSR
jgi:hypothetical protein